MSATSKNYHLILKCCKLYYEENYNQFEISNMLNISRPTVSRILSEAKEMGIVKIEIVNPFQNDHVAMERLLEKKFGLKEVLVTDEPETDDEMTKRKVGKLASDYLMRIVRKNDVIGISLGATIASMIPHLQYKKLSNLQFVPVLGGIGDAANEIHPNSLVYSFAEKLGGNYSLLYAPAIVSGEAVKEQLIQEESIHGIIEKAKQANIAVVGIGPGFGDFQSTMLETGYIKHNDIEELLANHVAGDICLQFYDQDGKHENFEFFNKRVLGLSLENIKKIDTVIGLGYGTHKVNGIIGAIRGKYINVLVTSYTVGKILCDL